MAITPDDVRRFYHQRGLNEAQEHIDALTDSDFNDAAERLLHDPTGASPNFRHALWRCPRAQQYLEHHADGGPRKLIQQMTTTNDAGGIRGITDNPSMGVSLADRQTALTYATRHDLWDSARALVEAGAQPQQLLSDDRQRLDDNIHDAPVAKHNLLDDLTKPRVAEIGARVATHHHAINALITGDPTLGAGEELQELARVQGEQLSSQIALADAPEQAAQRVGKGQAVMDDLYAEMDPTQRRV